jgi:pyruvate/2-oxoglutarate dehydrogenase complex dihydrolipoamide dehydrogenase (E3) component
VKVVVLGGGSSGEHFVGALRRLDPDVELTLVERQLVGGECSYWACMPTKTMLRAPELVASAKHTLGAVTASLDPAKAFAWRDAVAERNDSSQVEWLAKQHCELVRGDAVVTESGVVRVGDTDLAYDRLVIATGSSPVIPDVVAGLDYWTNREATETTEVPATLGVLGGGAVGCELAQFFARVGSRVIGLTISRRGIEVDERLRAADNVWAIGDVTGIAPFTHVGKYQARIAASDLIGRTVHADYRAIQATIFTDPQVATVGTLDGKTSTWPLSSVPRLSTYERPKRDGFIKVAADPERRVLTGAVAVGPEAGEWLQQLTLAIRAEVPIDVLLDVIQPYPTFSEGVFLALRELNFDL